MAEPWFRNPMTPVRLWYPAFCGINSAGRVSVLQTEGREFKSLIPHLITRERRLAYEKAKTKVSKTDVSFIPSCRLMVWHRTFNPTLLVSIVGPNPTGKIIGT